MTQQEAKKEVCGMAWQVLEAGPRPSNGGESEKDEARLDKAWEELLAELYRRNQKRT